MAATPGRTAVTGGETPSRTPDMTAAGRLEDQHHSLPNSPNSFTIAEETGSLRLFTASSPRKNAGAGIIFSFCIPDLIFFFFGKTLEH